MSSLTYLITEGVHDVAFLGKILDVKLQLKRVLKEDALDPRWTRLLPKAWPHKGSLRPAVPAPSFFQSALPGTSVAIVNAEGIDAISTRLRAHSEALALDGIAPDAVGAVLDADSSALPATRFERMARAFESMGLPRPETMEAVSGAPRVGVFILPGGGAPGTLEDILLECAAVTYPTLSDRAAGFIDGFDRTTPELTDKEISELKKPAGRNKAVVAAMSSILKPCKPIQATLEDHRWIEPRTLALPRVEALVRFLTALVKSPEASGAGAA